MKTRSDTSPPKSEGEGGSEKTIVPGEPPRTMDEDREPPSERAHDPDPDPFTTFTEWSGPIDEADYADL